MALGNKGVVNSHNAVSGPQRSHVRNADIHDKSLSREKRILLTRATEERVTSTLQNPQLAIVPRGEGSCLTQNQTSICCLGPVWPSQKIEFVFPASPETFRRGLGSICSVAQSAFGETWQAAR